MRRKFSREFKLEAVKLVRERGVSVAQVARDLDPAQVHGLRRLELVDAIELQSEPAQQLTVHPVLRGPVDAHAQTGDAQDRVVRRGADAAGVQTGHRGVIDVPGDPVRGRDVVDRPGGRGDDRGGGRREQRERSERDTA